MKKAAVVGTGFGCLTHVRALRRAGFEVPVLVGRDSVRTRARAVRFEVDHACTSLAEALTHDVDVVTIATPPDTHTAIALEAIAAGKHVVCEKPFALDRAQARRMRDAAARAGVVALLGCEFRFAPDQALLARVVRDGAIGDPKLATFMLHIPLLGSPAAEVPEWWSDRERGGGWLGAHGSHVVDQIRVTLGEFSSVSATLPSVSEHDWTAEDAYLVQFRMRSGAVGVMQAVASDWGPMLFVTRVAGSKGSAWTDAGKVFVADASGAREIPIPDDLVVDPPDPPPSDVLTSAYDLLHATGIDMGPYTRLFERLAALIDRVAIPPDPAPATFTDGVANMTVLDAIRRSANLREWVDIP
ncbi:MAG: Gfo/Idh/MocA family oxidoreductase [Actinomycetota bacterium]|nr:Gfo/Idh/MocA family oxidoreductase [Actinomycetota bacterium]